MLQDTERDQLLFWSMPYIIDPFLDSPIELCEIKNVIKSLKHNKTPGQDGIPYEFYKYAPNCFINELLQYLTRYFYMKPFQKVFVIQC